MNANYFFKLYSTAIALLYLLFCCHPSSLAADLVVGSKRFPESRLLAEIMAQLIEADTSLKVERRLGLGGTLICFNALKEGEIDFYPEYTGTGLMVILKHRQVKTDAAEIFALVKEQFNKKFDITWLPPLGFNNTYALVTGRDQPYEKISDLQRADSGFLVGFSHEFLNRPDGYRQLKSHYQLNLANVKGIEHGLMYEALDEGFIHLGDAYSTDGRLKKYNLKVLRDDLHFFPPYFAAPIIRNQSLGEFPELEGALEKLAGRLTDDKMQQLNFRVEVNEEPFSTVAEDFLVAEGLIKRRSAGLGEGLAESLAESLRESSPPLPLTKLVSQHLLLTTTATLIACLIGIPLGLLISQYPNWASPILGIAGVIQTIPSLALLGFMIPLLGIGIIPAIFALLLYALLPIIRNTYTGISAVSEEVKEAARAMGMTAWQRLFWVELPLATRTIMAGIRTAVVISIGTATLAAFIGAGGLGEPILTGLSLNDHTLILWGAVPAAILALLVDKLLAILESRLEPKGLRISRPE